MTREEWEQSEKRIDENFDGSIFETMGMTKYLCPVCNAHLSKSGICLNACHLGRESKDRFNREMSKL